MKLPLLIGAALRERQRWARQHLYALLVLSPLVGGMTYFTLARVVSYAPQGWQPTPAWGLAVMSLAVAALKVLSMSRASAELFHLRRPEAVLDALPAAPETHLHAALAARAARTSAIALAALVARAFLLDGEENVLEALPPLVAFVLVVAPAELFAALNWIHRGHRRGRARAFAALAVLAPCCALAGVLLLLAVRPAALPGGAGAWWWLMPAGGLCGVALYALTRRLHARWRAADIEYAKRLQAGGGDFDSRAVRAVAERVRRRPVAALLARDLKLTLRAFSSAVYVAALLAALWVALLAVMLSTDWVPASYMLPPGGGEASGLGAWFELTWLAPAVAAKVACVLAALSLVSLLPVLVSHQLPHLWLERAAGAVGEDLWRAKMWYARLVTLPAPLLAWACCVLAGGVPLAYAPALLAECVWLWWLVSTLAGSLAYEVPEQPSLALVLMWFAGLSGGLLTAWLWPAGLAAGMAISQAAERGPHRAHFLLTSEGG